MSPPPSQKLCRLLLHVRKKPTPLQHKMEASTIKLRYTKKPHNKHLTKTHTAATFDMSNTLKCRRAPLSEVLNVALRTERPSNELKILSFWGIHSDRRIQRRIERFYNKRIKTRPNRRITYKPINNCYRNARWPSFWVAIIKKSESELQGSNQIRPRRHVTKKNNPSIKTVEVSNKYIEVKYTLNSDVLKQHVRGSKQLSFTNSLETCRPTKMDVLNNLLPYQYHFRV